MKNRKAGSGKYVNGGCVLPVDVLAMKRNLVKLGGRSSIELQL
jgi:hypothetical protein